MITRDPEFVHQTTDIYVIIFVLLSFGSIISMYMCIVTCCTYSINYNACGKKNVYIIDY